MFWKPPLTKFTYPSNKILLPLEQNLYTSNKILLPPPEYIPTPLWNIWLPPHLFSGRGSLQKDLGKFLDFFI